MQDLALLILAIESAWTWRYEASLCHKKRHIYESEELGSLSVHCLISIIGGVL